MSAITTSSPRITYAPKCFFKKTLLLRPGWISYRIVHLANQSLQREGSLPKMTAGYGINDQKYKGSSGSWSISHSWKRIAIAKWRNVESRAKKSWSLWVWWIQRSQCFLGCSHGWRCSNKRGYEINKGRSRRESSSPRAESRRLHRICCLFCCSLILGTCLVT